MAVEIGRYKGETVEEYKTYDDFQFAYTWKNQIPTEDEIEWLKRYLKSLGYREKDFEIKVWSEYIDEIEDIIEAEVPKQWVGYIDVVDFLYDEAKSGCLSLYKLPSGYAVVIWT